MLIDMSVDSRQYAMSIKRIGATQIMRYVSRGGGSKCLTAAELTWLLANGYGIGIVSEVWGGSNPAGLGFDINAVDGTLDGQHALDTLKGFGFPQGSSVFFCIDTDVDNDNAINANVIPYLKDAQAALTDYYRAGVYGAGSTCAAALDACGYKLTMLAQSSGWTEYQVFLNQQRAAIIQGPDREWYDGPNQVMIPDWGVYTPPAVTA
jgi:hypothetical protein